MDNQQLRHTIYIAYSNDGRAYIGMKSWLSEAEYEAYCTTCTDSSFVYLYKEAVATFEDAHEAWQLEQKLIDTLGALRNKLFANRAKTPFAGVLRGSKRDEAFCAKMSEIIKDAMASPEVRATISEGVKKAQAKNGHPRKGVTLSEEQKAKSVNTRFERYGSYFKESPEVTQARMAKAAVKANITKLEKCLALNLNYRGTAPLTPDKRSQFEERLKQLYVKLNDYGESQYTQASGNGEADSISKI